MSTGKVLVIVSDSLAAVGLMAGVVVLLALFTFAAMKESPLPTTSAPVLDDFSPSMNSSPLSSPAQPLSSLPPLPIEINVPYRHLSSDGYVARFHNSSAKLLRVVFDMQSDTTHTYRTETYDIPASGTVEIGWDRGWKLSPNDRMTLSCDGYQTGTWTMP